MDSGGSPGSVIEVGIDSESSEYFIDPGQIEEISPPESPRALSSGNVEDGFFCLECGKPLEYSGRGRHPKYCDDHKPNKTRTSSKGSSSADKSLDAKLKRIAADFADNIRLTGALITPILPVTGTVVMRDAESVSTSIVRMARNKPEILIALQRASQISPAITVGKFAVTVGIAVMVDTQRIEPESPAATFLGVAALHAQIHSEEGQGQRAFVAPPPVAQMV